MKLIVNPHKIEIEKTPVNEKEVNITECQFEFSEEISNEFVKEAYFTLNGESYKQVIVNNECDIPHEVLEEKGTIEIGVVAFIIEDETIVKRYNPSPVYISTLDGSLKDAENSQPITPSEFEQYEQALQDGLTEIDERLVDVNTAITEVNNLDLEVSKTGTRATVTLTKKDGAIKQVVIEDGADFEYNWDGTSLGVKTSEEQEYQYVNLKGDTGDCSFATFSIVDGHLIMNKGENLTQLDFRLNPLNGHLEVEVGI